MCVYKCCTTYCGLDGNGNDTFPIPDPSQGREKYVGVGCRRAKVSSSLCLAPNTTLCLMPKELLEKEKEIPRSACFIRVRPEHFLIFLFISFSCLTIANSTFLCRPVSTRTVFEDASFFLMATVVGGRDACLRAFGIKGFGDKLPARPACASYADKVWKGVRMI